MRRSRLVARCVLGVVAVLGTPFAVQGAEPLPPPIIDMHMHVSGPLPRTDSGGVMPRVCLPHGWCDGAPTQAKDDAQVRALTLEAMQRNNIVLGFLSGPVDGVREWVDAAPGRFLAGPFIVNPHAVDLDQLRAAYRAGQLQGMGELATQLAGIGPDDPALEPLFALAEEFDLPTLIHLEGIGPREPTFSIAAGRPELLDPVLKRHPGLRVYLENAGFPRLAETISLMYMHPQVYADLSTVTWVAPRAVFYEYLKRLMDAGLGQRLMFGSDQMWWPETIDLGIEAIRSAPFLTEAHKRDIFYNNAARFLRLSPQEIARHHTR